MEVQFLKRKGHPYIYGATKELMKHEDLHPCDKDGNLLGVVSAPEAAGLVARRPEPDHGPSDLVIKNIMAALDVPEDVARNIALGGSLESKKIEPEPEVPEEKTLADMKASEMLEYSKKFGEKADHLYLAMGAVKLRAEIERLEAE